MARPMRLDALSVFLRTCAREETEHKIEREYNAAMLRAMASRALKRTDLPRLSDLMPDSEKRRDDRTGRQILNDVKDEFKRRVKARQAHGTV